MPAVMSHDSDPQEAVARPRSQLHGPKQLDDGNRTSFVATSIKCWGQAGEGIDQNQVGQKGLLDHDGSFLKLTSHMATGM